MAKTGHGAVELLRCGLVAHLIECQVFDMVPDSDANRCSNWCSVPGSLCYHTHSYHGFFAHVNRVMRDPSGFIPSPMDRYRQIILPALRLFQIILTSTTVNHQQGAAQASISKHCFMAKSNGVQPKTIMAFFWPVIILLGLLILLVGYLESAI